MQQINGWWLPDADSYFAPFIEQWGGFQSDHLVGAFEHNTRWGVAIDGGAHVGFWTRLFASRFQQVYAFEPSPDTFACLIRNCSDLLNVQCFQRALGKEYGTGAITDSVIRPGNTGARYLTEGTGVEVVPLDSMGLSGVDFLKLDVEGLEVWALQGAERLLREFHPLVLIEEKAFRDKEGRFPLHHKEAGQYLESLGAVVVARFRNDVLYKWRS